jgi:hypothetical protein
MLASTIFIFGIVMFYLYALNDPEEGKENLEGLFYDGKIIAESLLSEGYPKDWNSADVVTTGILSDNKINETKLERFYNLANSDYAKTRNRFNTQFDYYFFLSENMTINSVEVEGIGSNPPNPQNLVKITRFTVYKNRPVTAYIYVWN